MKDAGERSRRMMENVTGNDDNWDPGKLVVGTEKYC